ncbi:MAG: cupin domain-containing protein, partial [Chloroflexi bacterium]|nr:cupin domain-containing protein [Chloroflexota bacterium]
VLQGQASIGIGDETFDVCAGDVVFIPEGVPHWYQNVGEEKFEFLCIIPNKPDEIRIIGKEC